MKKLYMAALALIYAATLCAGDKLTEEQVFSSIKPKKYETSDNRLFFSGPPLPVTTDALRGMVFGDASTDPTKVTTTPTYIVTDEQLGKYTSQPDTEPETMGAHIRGLESSVEEDEGGSFKSLMGTKPTTGSLPKTPLTSEELEKLLQDTRK